MSAPHSLCAWIEGVGLIAPGMPDWASGADVLGGHAPFRSAPSVLPAPLLLPAAERRRASRVVRVALGCGLAALEHAGIDATAVPAIFSASTADGHNCHALCETLASDDQRVSPTRFHNSLHNTPAGYWSIATGAMSASQSLCAYDGSFSAGLLEAMVQTTASQLSTLLVAYDAEHPEPLFAVRPIPDAGGIGLVLSPEQTPRSLARIAVALTDTPPDTLADPHLDVLRTAIPALRGLPLLGLLAAGGSGCVALEYLAPLSLSVSIDPC
jgi:hypothetical protein